MLHRTPLHQLHLDHGGRLAEFAGYELPIRFEPGPMAEHVHTRTQASLFDVSHMGIVELRGPDCAEALQRLVPAAITTLGPGKARYTCLTNESGGIIDDLIVTNAGDHLSLVLNGARKAVDLAHLAAHLGDAVTIDHREDLALLALQGPQAAEVLDQFTGRHRDLAFMESAAVGVSGEALADSIPVTVSRSGYTGEDGFELAVAAHSASELASALLADDRVEPAGLAARDSLRLEAGLCLYGHDLDVDISPIEAGLTWSIQKARRTDGGFIGAEVICRQIAEGVDRQRVGIRPLGRRPIREGAALLAPDSGDTVGNITSGGFGPTVDAPIAMGYVASLSASVGTQLLAEVRGREEACEVVDMPFVATNYYRKP